MEECGVSWWKPWDIGDGTIGQRYGATVKRYDLINIASTLNAFGIIFLINDIIHIDNFMANIVFVLYELMLKKYSVVLKKTGEKIPKKLK